MKKRFCILGQDLAPVKKEFPPLWSILTENWVRCGVFGSLQSDRCPRSCSTTTPSMCRTPLPLDSECFPKGARGLPEI